MTLRDSGEGRLEVWVEKRKTDIVTFVRHRATAKSRATRGATTVHKSVEEARAAMATLATSAEKAGWKRSESRGGYAARPHSIDAAHLPGRRPLPPRRRHRRSRPHTLAQTPPPALVLGGRSRVRWTTRAAP